MPFYPKLFLQKVIAICSLIKWMLSCFFLFTTFQIGAQNTNIWADSCTSNTFKGKIQSDIPFVYSEFTVVMGYPGGDMICLGRIKKDNMGSVAMVLRLSPKGEMKWSREIKRIDYPYHFDLTVHIGVITSDGGIVLTTDYNLIKLSGNGDVIWSRKIMDASGPGSQAFQAIRETYDGGLIMAGTTGHATLVEKFNSQGLKEWTLAYNNYVLSACTSITETPDGFYFIARGMTGLAGDFTYNILTKINKNSGAIIWSKALGKTTPITRTEYSYDDIQYINNQLVLSGFTNYDYIGPNPVSQSIVKLTTEGQIVSAKKIFNGAFQANRSLLFRNRLFNSIYNIGVQYSIFQEGFCVYKIGQQNSVDWAMKYPEAGRTTIWDMELSQDTSIYIAGVYEDFPGADFYAMLVKTNAVGKLPSCSGTSIPITVSDDIITVEPYTLPIEVLQFPNPPNQDIVIRPGTDFSFVVTCTQEVTAKLGKISGPQTVCRARTEIYKAARSGTSVQPLQYSISPSSATINYASDSSVSVNFPNPGRYVLYALMPSDCKTLKDSIIIDVADSPGPVILGPDIVLCRNNSFSLNAKKGYLQYEWQDGSTDSIFVVAGPGQYFVKVTDYCGAVFTDTINVSEDIIPFTQMPDRIKCNADTIHLNAMPGFTNYRWQQQNSSVVLPTQNIITNTAASTQFYLTAEARPGCIIFDTVNVQVFQSPLIHLGKDTGFCKGGSVQLNAGNQHSNYIWNTGSASPVIQVVSAGEYIVKGLYSNGCLSSDTVNIIEYREPFASLGNDDQICNGSPRKLQTTILFSKYLWQDGSTQQFYQATQPGSYTVKVTDANGCTAETSIFLKAVQCITGIFMPTAFTPNNDNINDNIKPIVKGTISKYYFMVFNRYGEIIFQSEVPGKGWSGIYKGSPQNAGTYTWFCQYQFEGQEKKEERGSFILIR